MYMFKDYMHLETYTFTASYRKFLEIQPYTLSFFLRLLQLIFGTVFSLALICIFGNNKTKITRIGSNSIYPYALHNYVLAFYYFLNRHLGFFKYINSIESYI